MITKVNTIRAIKKILNIPFRFICQNSNFFSEYANCLHEVLYRSEKSPLLDTILKELVAERCIAEDGVKHSVTDFAGVTVHDVYIRNYDGRVYARGTSTNMMEAYAKALGEIFERQSFDHTLQTDSQTTKATEKELQASGVPFIPLTEYFEPTEAQVHTFPGLFNTSEDTIFSWTDCVHMSTQRITKALTQDAFWGATTFLNEPSMSHGSTHGCGGGYTEQEAFQSAAYEVIQRDAFFKYWYAGRSPNQIHVDSIEKGTKVAQLIDSLKKFGFSMHLLDLTDEASVPTVAAVLYTSHTGWFVGASTNTTKLAAIERALMEALSVYIWMNKEMLSGRYDIASESFNSIKGGFLDERVTSKTRCMLWGSRFFQATQSDFFINGQIVQFSESTSATEVDLQCLLEQKYSNVYLCKGIHPLGHMYDYHAVKLIIPAAHPVYLNEIFTRSCKSTVYPQNCEPHPFP